MKEYGSFLPLDLRQGEELYAGDNVKSLNTARGGIYYILKLLGLKKLLMPRYQCKTVRDFLLSRQIELSFFDIDSKLMPKLFRIPEQDTAVLLVNYFGLLSDEKLAKCAAGCSNLIIDHSQAFYKRPHENAYSVYSPRKFFGVPDGCYVIGGGVNHQKFEIERDNSYPTSLFLLERIETSSSATYPDRMKNEKRLDESDMLEMSRLTQKLLQNIDYEAIKEKRVQNFHKACELFNSINLLDMQNIIASCADTVPMAYPLVIEDDGIRKHLLQNKIYIAKLWNYLISETHPDSVEMWLSRFMLPLPVDQRMNADDLTYIFLLVEGYCKSHGIHI